MTVLQSSVPRPRMSAREEVLTVGMTLFDQKSDAIVFDVNFWHWRAIIEAIRSLRILPDERVDALHKQFAGELTQEEARTVAVAIRERLLPTLADDERLLLDGRRNRAGRQDVLPRPCRAA